MCKHFLFLCVFLAACASPNQINNVQIVDNATEAMRFCLDSPRSQGKKASCAENFYEALSHMSDEDYGKLPALRMATAMYVLFQKVDRKQINESELKAQMMQIKIDLQVDLNNSRRQADLDNKAAARQQQQMLMEAQRLLSPPSNVINCFRAPGSPVTSCY